MSDLTLRGSAEVMTDGAGGFRFSGLPEGTGFQFEFKTAVLENGVQPIMDRVKLSFE